MNLVESYWMQPVNNLYHVTKIMKNKSQHGSFRGDNLVVLYYLWNMAW